MTARDAGQVIFFCGAGVSQARACLPNFASLAGRVLSSLGSALDSPARRLFEASQTFAEQTGLTGVVATDHIFGLLEREFYPDEVQQAVAAALRPPDGYELGAHRILLDLSRDAGGVVRLVTTNFDLLFEECDPDLGSFNPPHLPDPRREKDFRGVMHIHGRVDASYGSACDGEFVLSSADFGRAYLADGWATRYIQALLQRYKIVFVGYSADDPPLQYLLEALSRGEERRGDLFAFQAGNAVQAEAQWAHKGVTPLPYDSANGHVALWQTLEAWAVRARDVDAWHKDMMAKAAAGPADLAPHERGIIAHLAATRDGARRLASKECLLPAEWLCVLDPSRRYAPPGPIDPYDENSDRFDPFDAFGLDSDRPPVATDPDDRFARRETPADAWDLLAPADDDRLGLPADGTGRLRGREAALSANLPRRLWHLAMYLVRVAHQPAAVWWAAHQRGLHPDIIGQLEWSLRQEADRFAPNVARAWRLLIAVWRERRPDADHRRYEIEALVKKTGWSTELVRATVDMYRSALTAQAPFGTIAPADRPDVPLEKMLRVDVDYRRPHEPLTIPPEHLAYAATLFRSQIEHAIALEREIGNDDSIYFDVTRAADGEAPDEDGFKLTGHLATLVNMVARLAETDPAAAQAEVDRWPANTNQVFNRLRIWAASQPAILNPAQAAAVFLTLDERSFWTDQQERDLLYAMRDRWTDLAAEDRQRLEQRLLTGAFPWSEPREDLARVKAYYRLNRLQWLHDHGVTFGFDIEAVMAENRRDAPDWEPRFAERVAQPKVGKVRSISTDTDPAALAGLPIARVLAVAREATQRDYETFIDHRPFRGLADERPAFALAVLTDANRKGDTAEREWAVLLHATGSGERQERLLRTVAFRVTRLPLDQVAALRHPISEWMRDRAPALLVRQPDVFVGLWDRLSAALAAHPPKDRFRRPDDSWVDSGLNQPAGRLVDALFRDPAKADFTPERGLSEQWKACLDRLLDLPGDARRHAIAMISPHANWLHYVDPDWTERRLLVFADQDGADAQAFWGGYFWAARTPQLLLYQRLKPAFLTLSRSSGNRREHASKLAGMLLAGWAGSDDPAIGDALIPDVELREVLIHADDNLRVQTLWYLERWSNEPGSSWGDKVLPFLRDVWPRQRATRTPQTSARLVDFALAQPDRFPGIVEIVLPLLSPIAGASVRMGPFLEAEAGIAARHPRELLDLLWRVLSEDPWTWPYETRRVLEALSAREEVANDPRLTELMRRDQQR